MRVAVVGCRDSDSMSWDDEVLVETLLALGVDAERPIWNDPDVDWGRYGLIVIRSTWDYHYEPQRFLDWLDRVSQTATVVNPPEVIHWNSHKRYLLELAGKGVPVVPTVLCEKGSTTLPAEALGWGKIVIKPAVSASAHKTVVTEASSPDAAAHLAHVCEERDALVQPFLSAIQSSYEVSVVFLDGEYSHAVHKRAKEGDFRVQFEFGGASEPAEPTAGERAVADKAMGALDHVPMFARVDLCKLDDGTDVLMELELIEPELWLYEIPQARERLAESIKKLSLALA